MDAKNVADFESYDGTYKVTENEKPGILLYFETGSNGETKRLVVFKKVEKSI